MKTLNLTDLSKSDIKYKISRYPDGQQNIVIEPFVYKEWKDAIFNSTFKVQIKSRLNNFLDLELIIASTASLRELGVKEIHLYVPYFLGARADRKFEEGGNNYLKDVICPIINSLKFDTVTVLDPHSHVLEACLTNFKKEDNCNIVSNTLEDLYVAKVNFKIRQSSHITFNTNECVLVSPDAGASHKIYKLADQIGYKGDIITCSKERDVVTGKPKVSVPEKIENADKDFIIIDDICDGGATFINIAEKIKSELKDNKIYLIVTHGIFSKGLEELNEYFDGIYCTNSYRQVNDEEWMNCKRNFVKQLNIF